MSLMSQHQSVDVATSLQVVLQKGSLNVVTWAL